MSSEKQINFRTFPLIKLISSLLIIFGAVLTYIFSMSIPGVNPEIFLFQVGGVSHGLVLGIPSLLSGLVLLIYSFMTFYKFSITENGGLIELKAKKKQIKINKEDIMAVRVRDAGKFFIWFVFVFINFLFVFYGLETGLYFSANHNAGLYEFIIIPLLMIWLGGVLLIIFPRKLVAIITKDTAILQKVNRLPKDRSFQLLMDNVFDLKEIESNFIESKQSLHRLVLGIITLSLFIITSLLVQIDGIYQPLYDIGIFLPMFILIFSILMLSSGISGGKKQSINSNQNTTRFEEITYNSKIIGNNYLWFKSNEDIRTVKFVKEFRILTWYDMMLIFLLFGGALFLGFKIFWNLPLYINYFNWIDLMISILLLIMLFLYQFESVLKLNAKFESTYQLVREIIIFKSYEVVDAGEERNLNNGFINGLKNYLSDFKKLIRNKSFKVHIAKIGLTYFISLIVITISYQILGFILFIFI